MARSHLTLAALATSAVPGLDVARARLHSRGSHGLFDSALIVDRSGRQLIIRVPRDQSAETEQSADLVALRALTLGNRSRLPFDVPEYVGQAPVGNTRAVVYELLPGDMFETDDLTSHAGVSGSIGRAIAAIHGLPTAFVAAAGLPQQSAEECRTSTIDLIDRAANTGHLPAALLRRWEQATDDDALWQFPPTVVNGTLSAESFLITDDAVSGVVGWSGLAVGDPARDLHWLLAARGDEAETAIATYIAARQGGDPRITQRAMLYAELELARWLLHGIETRNSSIVDDAVGMLDGLVDTVHSHTTQPLSTDSGPVLEVADVEAMLAQTPRRNLGRDQRSAQYGAAMHTDSYDLASFRDSEFDDTDPDDTGYHASGFVDAGIDRSEPRASQLEDRDPADDESLRETVSSSAKTPDHAATRSASE